ncbi:hypothetical protein [Streptomyces sp. NPDC091259]|uniref:hypothetical protein n=1 Tax=Streptomyces sp. NPDC091259 TaxID=3365976 RepID=UPI0038299CD5
MPAAQPLAAAELPERRTEARAYLAGSLTPRTRRYFARRRLTVPGLPGGVAARPAFLTRSALLRRVGRRVLRRLR